MIIASSVRIGESRWRSRVRWLGTCAQQYEVPTGSGTKNRHG
jgi:hypothetical protein